jgi:hypothetical protein
MKKKVFTRAKHNPMALSLRNFKSARVKSVKHYTRKEKHKGQG